MSASQVILAVWLTLLGGCVGSFLNVVIYRLPRRMSLVHPGSRCPHCGHAIRWYHNIPVLGWLIIRGRCHDCGAAISIRYPAIEAIVAGMFLAVAWRGPLSVMAESAEPGRAIPMDAWVLFGADMVLLCGLLVVAVMEIDARADEEVGVPWRLIGGLVLTGLLVPIGLLGTGSTAAGGFTAAGGSWLAGLAAAVMLAMAVRPAATEPATTARGRRFAVAGFLVSGAFLGVVPTCVLATATAASGLLITGLARLMAIRYSPPWTPVLWALTLGGILVCGLALRDRPELGPWGRILVALGLASVTGVLSLGSLVIGDRRGTD